MADRSVRCEGPHDVALVHDAAWARKFFPDIVRYLQLPEVLALTIHRSEGDYRYSFVDPSESDVTTASERSTTAGVRQREGWHVCRTEPNRDYEWHHYATGAKEPLSAEDEAVWREWGRTFHVH